jgi:hypothetical protein
MERGQRRTHGTGDGRGRDGDCACGNSLHGELHGAEPGKRPSGRGRFSVPGAKRSPIAAAIPTAFEWSARCGYVSPSTVSGGATARGTVSLDAGAPAGGVVVQLSSSNPNVANVPATATIPAGFVESTFNITTNQVAARTLATLSGVPVAYAQRGFDSYAASDAGAGFGR